MQNLSPVIFHRAVFSTKEWEVRCKKMPPFGVRGGIWYVYVKIHEWGLDVEFFFDLVHVVEFFPSEEFHVEVKFFALVL